MTRAIKAGLVALSGATLLIAFAVPGWVSHEEEPADLAACPVRRWLVLCRE
jgi:hypothetical protein